MYSKLFSGKVTPQSRKIPGRKMKKNAAGGYAFKITKWERLERFLILGSDSGSYYIGPLKLTAQNAKNVIACIKKDGRRVVNMMLDISENGRAVKNDPVIFAWALAMTHGDKETKSYAVSVLPRIARYGTMWFAAAAEADAQRGWGKLLKEAFQNLYNNTKLSKLAYQIVKYQQRNGWSHQDLLRLAHPKTENLARNALFGYVVGKAKYEHGGSLAMDNGHTFWHNDLLIIEGFEKAKLAQKPSQIVSLIRLYGLTREMIDNKWLKFPQIWEALLERMPMTAMIRNLGKMTNIGLIAPFSDGLKSAVAKLGDAEYLRKSRVHPFNVLVTMGVYAQGHGMRGKLIWTPQSQVIDALDGAFYAAFKNVEPTGKNFVLALDVSGSMGDPVGTIPLTCRQAAAAMSMITARTEKNHKILGFTSSLDRSRLQSTWYTGIIELPISSRQRLDAIVKTITNIKFGRTDCALPMLWAINNKVPNVDVFIIYTDNEPWAGSIHPTQALEQYRRMFNPNAKLIACAFTPSHFSVADPNDPLSLDICGMDTSVPQVIREFV